MDKISDISLPTITIPVNDEIMKNLSSIIEVISLNYIQDFKF